MRPTTLVVILGLLAAACSSVADEPEAPTYDPVLVSAAEALCPVMWEWQKSVGATMNAMSYDTRRESDPGARRARYVRAFDQVRELNAQLDATIVSLADAPPLDTITPDIRDGIDMANTILESTRAMIEERYSEGEPAYNEIVPVIFLDLEKVIDVAKPEMATYDDPELIGAFTSVPQCQHGVKDANDGVPRYVP